MSAEIVTGKFCADWFSAFYVRGSSGNRYLVTFEMNVGPHCTCPAFQYAPDGKKTCKHVKEVMAKACLWNEQWYAGGTREMKPIAGSLQYPTISEVCPKCGGPVCPVKIAV